MQRRGTLALTAVAVLSLAPLAATAAPGGGGPRGSARSQVATVTHGDRDGNRLDDAFQGKLAGARPGARFDVIVTGVGSGAAKRAVGSFHVDRQLPLIAGFSASMTAGQARALARVPGVRRVELNGTVRITDDGSNRDFGATQVPLDHPGVDGSGVGLCVVDTGVDPNHEQIAPRTVTFYDAINGRTTPYDDHGHGTHVMSIAAGDGTGGTSAATFVGVAPAATLYAAKALDATGNGTDAQVVAGVQWCAGQAGVGVISMSLGDPIGGNGTDALSLAVNAAVNGGKVVVVAAGNSGDQPGTINAPGTATGAITVGAVSEHSNPAGTLRRDDGIWLAAFSSRGPTVDGRTKPDLVAPGVSVTAASAGSAAGYTTLSGTSMATPYVAGAAVLAREANPAATPAMVRAALTGTAKDVGATGADNEYGAGLVDVRATVDQLAGASPVRRTAFPVFSRVNVTVPTGGSVNVPITVPTEGVGVPLAISMHIAGQPLCYYGCFWVEWDPDLDMELRSPTNQVVAVSECALDGLQCGVGRQETIAIRPAAAGTYTLRVYAWQGGAGAPVSIDISQGPLGGAVTPPPPPPPANVAPTARAGADKTYRVNKKTGVAAFTLDGSASTDPDGTIVSYVWTLTTAPGGTFTGATVPQSRPPGTYDYVLTVTDDDGATGVDTVRVTVKR
ncbi:MAG TPA: S8 family serine peptidase [Nocardioidaceae bacterium]|nr:S8 family serine peptidase [Nocardioidaceae bacterium]